MGFDLDLFVDGKSISNSLICGICLGVVEEPVLTPTDSLYCEACLLEWLTKSSLDPLTNVEIEPERITKPSRLVLNILSDLIRKCPNEGCTWQGSCDLFRAHVKSCQMVTREKLLEKIQNMEAANEVLQKTCTESRAVSRGLLLRVDELVADNHDLRHELSLAHSKLRVYDEFFARSNASADSRSGSAQHHAGDSLVSVLGRHGPGLGVRSGTGRGDGPTAFDDINDYYGQLAGDNDDDGYDDHEEEEEEEDAAFREAIGTVGGRRGVGVGEGKVYQKHHAGGNAGAKHHADDDDYNGGGEIDETINEIQRLRSLATFAAATPRK